MYDQNKCVLCKRCVSLCAKACHSIKEGEHIFSRNDCIACGECLSPLCEALTLSGKEVLASEVLTEVLKDSIFYKTSRGGLTLSGGEPLAQSDFCVEILRLAKEKGLHTCIETCGYASKEAIIQSAEYTDLYLFDIKETDKDLHVNFTGVGNKQILENLSLLNNLGKDIVLRCPLIPNFNCRDEHLIEIAKIANSLDRVIGIEIEPYHELGISKYERLGQKYSLGSKAMPVEYYTRYVELLKNHTGKPVKILEQKL